MDGMVDTLRSKFVVLRPVLDERARRLWAATEARAIGRGGIARVVAATGMSRGTVRAGLKELESGAVSEPSGEAPSGRLRRPGGGRKRVTDLDPALTAALERQLEPVTRGDPESPLRWTCHSAARLADRLTVEGHPVSERTVNRLLHDLGYSLQANRKTLEGRQHPDRDAQFRRIDRRVRAFQRLGQPVVSVDTKKKEVVGQYRNGGREWHPKGDPEAVKGRRQVFALICCGVARRFFRSISDDRRCFHGGQYIGGDGCRASPDVSRRSGVASPDV